MKHALYVYGTLRTGSKENTFTFPGEMYDLGSFPGVLLRNPDSTFVAERLEVTDEQLEAMDRYEGYREDDPENSLYIRTRFMDGWIYEYNHPGRFHSVPIEGGDWLEHKGEGFRNVVF